MRACVTVFASGASPCLPPDLKQVYPHMTCATGACGLALSRWRHLMRPFFSRHWERQVRVQCCQGHHSPVCARQPRILGADQTKPTLPNETGCLAAMRLATVCALLSLLALAWANDSLSIGVKFKPGDEATSSTLPRSPLRVLQRAASRRARRRRATSSPCTTRARCWLTVRRGGPPCAALAHQRPPMDRQQVRLVAGPR